MQKINKFLLIVLLVLCGLSSTAQTKNPYPDTLKLVTDSQIEMVFTFYEMRDHKEYFSNDLWKSILSVMQSAVEASPKVGGLEVSYRELVKEDGELAQIEVQSLTRDTDIFIIENDGMKELLSSRFEFKIYQPEVAIFFAISELSELAQLSEVNVESVWKQVEQKFENYGRRDIYHGTGIIKYGNANIDIITTKVEPGDQIELTMGIGIGFYRDRFIPDLGFKVGFNFSDRYGVMRVKTGLLYTQQYLFTASEEPAISEPNVNGFLSGFFNLKYGNDNEVGVGLGYLIHRQGDFYRGNTFKFSLYNQKKNSAVSFTPELVFSNDFKQAFPALRFGLSF